MVVYPNNFNWRKEVRSIDWQGCSDQLSWGRGHFWEHPNCTRKEKTKNWILELPWSWEEQGLVRAKSAAQGEQGQAVVAEEMRLLAPHWHGTLTSSSLLQTNPPRKPLQLFLSAPETAINLFVSNPHPESGRTISISTGTLPWKYLCGKKVILYLWGDLKILECPVKTVNLQDVWKSKIFAVHITRHIYKQINSRVCTYFCPEIYIYIKKKSRSNT